MIKARFSSSNPAIKHRNIEVPDDFIMLKGEFNEQALRSRAYQELYKRDPSTLKRFDKFEWSFK